MDKKFLEVLQHEGPVTMITLKAQPVNVVSTWMSYLKVDPENELLYAPAAGMRSIENDFQTDQTLLLTFGSKEVEGTVGPGAGFYATGQGSFLASGPIYAEFKQKFPWVRKVLQVKITKIEQKI